jgi:glucosylceramidase
VAPRQVNVLTKAPMMRNLSALTAGVVAAVAMSVTSSASTAPLTADSVPGPAAAATSWTAWRTSPTDSSARLTSVPRTQDTATTVLSASPSGTHQTWRGTGAALTDASVGLLSSSSTATGMLFDPARTDGAHLNLVRLPLTATDFSTTGWTFGWNDMTRALTEPKQALTSTAFLTGQIESLRPDVQAIAVPWTAPGAMKDSGILNGGGLLTSSVPAYGRMLAAQADWLRSRGVALLALTLGNEPFHSTPSYPTMTMTDSQMINLAKQTSPSLRANETELWSVDHNWGDRSHYDTVHAGAPGSFSAAAFHCYSGSVSQMTGVAPAPVMTECTGTTDGFVGTFRWDMQNLVAGAIDAGSTGLLMWNLALDQNSGPHTGGCGTCRGVVTVNTQTEAVAAGPEFYTLAHVSRAADPGAVVIDKSWAQGINYAAFKNPNGDIGIVGHNDSGSSQVVAVSLDGVPTGARFTVQPGDLFTFRGPPASTSMPSVTAGTVSLDDITPTVGTPVTASTTGWGPTPVNLTYQWSADDNPVDGATGSSFTPTGAHVGAQLAVTVTGTKSGYTPSSATSLSMSPVSSATLQETVLSSTPPVITGDARVGQQLVTSTGIWSPTDATTTFQWFQDGDAILGETSRSYAARPADVGSWVTVQVTASAPGLQPLALMVSPPHAVEPGHLLLMRSGAIHGVLRVGSTLRVADVATFPSTVAVYQWRRNGTPIVSAAGRRSRYLLRPADRGARMSVRVRLHVRAYDPMTVVVKRSGVVT